MEGGHRFFQINNLIQKPRLSDWLKSQKLVMLIHSQLLKRVVEFQRMVETEAEYQDDFLETLRAPE